MNATEFCYWLQGYFELDGDLSSGINPHRSKIIREHLNLVFTNVTSNNFPLFTINNKDNTFVKHGEDTKYC
jgi:hypothetical protein